MERENSLALGFEKSIYEICCCIRNNDFSITELALLRINTFYEMEQSFCTYIIYNTTYTVVWYMAYIVYFCNQMFRYYLLVSTAVLL